MLSDPAFRRQILVVLAVRTALNTAHRIVYPFLPSIARGLGISLAAASGLVTLRLVAGMTAPLIGMAGDWFGRRSAMVAGLLLFSLAGLLLGGTGTLAAAAVAFALYGFAKVLYDPAVLAYMGDRVPYQQRARAIGTLELTWSAAWLLGVPASGFLIERFGWQAPWTLLAAIGLAGAGLTHVTLPATPQQLRGTHYSPLVTLWVSTWRRLLRRRAILVLLSTSMLLMLAQEMAFIVYGAWLETSFGLSLSTLGLASIAVGLADATAELGTTVITDRLGKRKSVLIGLLGFAASLAALPWLSQHGLMAAIAGVVLMMLTFEFAVVSLLPMATELAPQARASLLSINAVALSLGRIAGAAAGGWLWVWRAQTITLNALVGSACALLALAVFAWGLPEIGD